MSPIDSFKRNFECPVCLNLLVGEVVSLDCTNQHKMCIECAMQIFGEMKDGIVSKQGPCPLRCAKNVKEYCKESFIPNLAKKINDSIESILEALKCPGCKEYLEKDVVTLNCSLQHKMCYPCARKIFREISKNTLLAKNACPLGCKDTITAYTDEWYIQTIVEQAKDILLKKSKVQEEKKPAIDDVEKVNWDGDPITFMIFKKNQMIKEGMHPATASYLMHKEPWRFYFYA